MNISTHFLETSIAEFRKYKGMGDKAMGQLHTDAEMHWKPSSESNSMAVIVRHMHGNMMSRWTDFLTSDGEKPDRHRDNEFVETQETKAELTGLWEKGWKCVFDALTPLTEDNLLQNVTIRKEQHTVMQTIIRQISHYSGHVGQMIYIAKAIRDEEWQTLSIARGKSEAFNRGM
jgi:hypothetical protein